MKELYISPEMKLLSFVPAEKLASSNNVVDFDSMPGSGFEDPTSGDTNLDVNVDITLN